MGSILRILIYLQLSCKIKISVWQTWKIFQHREIFLQIMLICAVICAILDSYKILFYEVEKWLLAIKIGRPFGRPTGLSDTCLTDTRQNHCVSYYYVIGTFSFYRLKTRNFCHFVIRILVVFCSFLYALESSKNAWKCPQNSLLIKVLVVFWKMNCISKCFFTLTVRSSFLSFRFLWRCATKLGCRKRNLPCKMKRPDECPHQVCFFLTYCSRFLFCRRRAQSS